MQQRQRQRGVLPARHCDTRDLCRIWRRGCSCLASTAPVEEAGSDGDDKGQQDHSNEWKVARRVVNHYRRHRHER